MTAILDSIHLYVVSETHY